MGRQGGGGVQTMHFQVLKWRGLHLQLQIKRPACPSKDGPQPFVHLLPSRGGRSAALAGGETLPRGLIVAQSPRLVPRDVLRATAVVSGEDGRAPKWRADANASVLAAGAKEDPRVALKQQQGPGSEVNHLVLDAASMSYNKVQPGGRRGACAQVGPRFWKRDRCFSSGLKGC